ncbi:C-C motif chemokine 28 precursor [Takifugu rubripes]|nr:C-C motif chemokine 28 precursor [Takifugu rubripes]BAL41012.1 chemokine C-C motif ligand 28 [Takifugu rubripes]|eukprot:NP_001266955.1 C-C motif chemokine 28 precursor [Takifugu rubripes]
MDLKVVAVLICLSAFAISSTQAAIPGCCINTRKIIPINVLRKVSRWTIQSSGGACDIDAVILHVRDKRICVDQTVFKDIWWRMKQWKQRVKKRAAKYNV